MGSEYPHRILVVDTDKSSRRIFDTVTTKKGIELVYHPEADTALKEISGGKKMFSAVIAARDLGSMTGTDLLSEARKQAPESIRVLMTSHSKIDTVVQAINKGAIQNYIVKPLTEENVKKALKSCIRQFSLFLEEKKLFKKVKKQQKKLYLRDRKLMKNAKEHDQIIHDLDHDIAILKKKIQRLAEKSRQSPDDIGSIIKSHCASDGDFDSQKIKTLFQTSLHNLYHQFNNLSYRNGFEMPDIKGELQ